MIMDISGIKPEPAWFPSENELQNSNIAKFIKDHGAEFGFENYPELHRFSVICFDEFWQKMVQILNIQFDKPYHSIADLSVGFENPKWFPGAKLNIVKSCFRAYPNKTAIISQAEDGLVTRISYQELNEQSDRVAIAVQRNFKKGDRIAIIMPMTQLAVAIYLGIIKAGCVAVSIADSFAAEEIAVRLKISNTKAVFTQDVIIRGGKTLPLYERVKVASPKAMIVLSAEELNCKLRKEDISWHKFLENTKHQSQNFTPVSCDPEDYINILFSSGTTGDPKAIPWTQTTPIKCASDAYFHHNIQPTDIFCWPSNLGWMMGPWLIFAALINKASMAIYEGTPNGVGFGEFIQNSGITLLGVVPTIVNTWRITACMEKLDWSKITLFTSTGETSNADDMLYLMNLAGLKPVIEYCGGTEIGGAYITGTVVQPSAPAACTTPAMGLDFILLDENGNAAELGEVALIPPSIGLSTELLNKDHHQAYYEGMPTLPNGTPLRRHGDQIERFANGFYRMHGRVDDTMKLSGIKVSSAEIERLLNTLEGVFETAAIAIEPPGGGPNLLIIYLVLIDKSKQSLDSDSKKDLTSKYKTLMQKEIKEKLNPLFKIHDVILIDALPRTASNKVMRRVLRSRVAETSRDRD